MKPTRYDITLCRQDPKTAADALAHHTGISKTRIKEAMMKGAVWHQRPNSKRRRIRRATSPMQTGDRLLLFYDPSILALKPTVGECLKEYQHYSIWLKPSGLLTQGTHYGDHCALMRQVEHHFQHKRKVFLVHRLDREAAGLVIMAHNRKAAALFSNLFQCGAVTKQYRIRVKGDLSGKKENSRIDLPLDNKSALTEFTPLSYDAAGDQTLADVRLYTGRYHQIRRHFNMIGHPVMGDPRYGLDNRNKQGLQLLAYRLEFECPFGGGRIETRLDLEKWGMQSKRQ